MTRTRVKFCGFTRAEDVADAVHAGADAIGFVCYPQSRRYVTTDRLAGLARALPPYVTPVLLFVNTDAATVARALAQVPDALLQFQGDESAAVCAGFGRPFVRAIHMEKGVDLLDCERTFDAALALLADTPTKGFGGSGERFDWSLIPPRAQRRKALVLAGGLTEGNVGEAIAAARPFAVDVSSGIESSPGIKSAEKMLRFMAAVRAADLSLAGS